MTVDYGALNSAAKYPSIETYHALGDKGLLIEDQPTAFTGQVILTEKVDGTNGRIIVMPDGDWFIGSREELLYARGDRIVTRTEGIVPALLPLAQKIATEMRMPTVFFLEVYGYRIGGAAKNYTTTAGLTGCRLFDVAGIPADVLSWPREKIASWREHGGQAFAGEAGLREAAAAEGVELTPRLGTVDADDLPRDLDGMRKFLGKHAPRTFVALDGSGRGAAEGIVLRMPDRAVIAKARFADYDRTLAKRAEQRRD